MCAWECVANGHTTLQGNPSQSNTSQSGWSESPSSKTAQTKSKDGCRQTSSNWKSEIMIIKTDISDKIYHYIFPGNQQRYSSPILLASSVIFSCRFAYPIRQLPVGKSKLNYYNIRLIGSHPKRHPKCCSVCLLAVSLLQLQLNFSFVTNVFIWEY